MSAQLELESRPEYPLYPGGRIASALRVGTGRHSTMPKASKKKKEKVVDFSVRESIFVLSLCPSG
jgi:hypothetical protein